MSDIPQPEQKIVRKGDVTAQSGELLDVISGGGIAIVGLDVTYAIVGHTEAAIRRMFAAKERSFEKPCGMFSNWDLFNEVQIVGQRECDVLRSVIFDHDLPMSTVAPFRADHPIFRDVAPFVLANSTKAGTIDMLFNAGDFHNEMTRQSLERMTPIFGSSANASLKGSKYRLEDIEAPVRAAADMLIDGGLSKYHNTDGRASSIIDMRTFKTVRIGVCYERLCEIFKKEFAIDLLELGMA